MFTQGPRCCNQMNFPFQSISSNKLYGDGRATEHPKLLFFVEVNRHDFSCCPPIYSWESIWSSIIYIYIFFFLVVQTNIFSEDNLDQQGSERFSNMIHISYHGNLRPLPANPPRNKALSRGYQPWLSLNHPLINLIFWGPLRFPWIYHQDDKWSQPDVLISLLHLPKLLTWNCAQTWLNLKQPWANIMWQWGNVHGFLV